MADLTITVDYNNDTVTFRSDNKQELFAAKHPTQTVAIIVGVIDKLESIGALTYNQYIELEIINEDSRTQVSEWLIKK